MKPRVKLLPGVPHRSLRGHPWIFANEVGEVEGTFDPGDVVEVLTPKGKFIGLGYINPKSMIMVRMLTREDREVNRGFFRERLEKALEYRRAAFSLRDFSSFGSCPEGYRLVYSEADFLPGLIVDIFAGYMVFQTLTLGIERWKDQIIRDLAEMVCPKGIYERNDAPVRELEGLAMAAGFYGKPFDPLVELDEYGVRVLVDVQKGQKTGYFLDQSLNRTLVRSFTQGKSVLDAFSYSGGFGLSSAYAGASEVVFVDASEAALDLAKGSASKNDFRSTLKYRIANAFDFLREFEAQGGRFDVVILDPPAFARSRRAVTKALAGYKEINLRAMKVLNEGGFLCTSSCSHHVTSQEFDAVLEEAAKDAAKYLRIVEARGARKDHPVLLGVPETEYLKFRVLQVFSW